MLERFRAHLEATGLIPPGARVLVGYSGGADSTCLLHLLRECGVDVLAAHLHHGQRLEAEHELLKCQQFCDGHGIAFVSGRANVPKMADEQGMSLEEAGRHARYQFFQTAMAQTGCDLVATAHTRTDHVETVLLNLTRGAGLAGLSGIPARRDNIIRPLLPFSRDETSAYCEERGFWTHDDPANSDITFSRARVRHRIKPEFTCINPRFEEVVARLSEIVGAEDQFLNGAAAAGLERAEIRLNGDLWFLTNDAEVGLDVQRLIEMPEVLLKRALRLAVRFLGAELTFEHTEALAEGVSRGQKGSLTCEGGRVVAEWDAQVLHIRDLAPDVPYRYPLTVPGETFADTFGWQFSAFEALASKAKQGRRGLSALCNPRAIKGPLYFRTAEPGDRIQPLGFEGHRKLSDLMSETKLTLAARSRLPIVCDLLGPLWAPGVCLDERSALAQGDSKALHLIFGPIRTDSGHNEGNYTTLPGVP